MGRIISYVNRLLGLLPPKGIFYDFSPPSYSTACAPQLVPPYTAFPKAFPPREGSFHGVNFKLC